MNAGTVRLVLDLSKQNNRLNEIIKLRQGEGQSTMLQAEILDHTQDFDLSGCNAELHLQKPNTEVLVQQANISDGKVSCLITGEVTSRAGDAKAYFEIFDKDRTVINTTNTFYLKILPSLIPVKEKENEPQPIDLHTLSNNNERKAEWI